MSTAPPQDLEAETAILGTILLAPATIGKMLGPDHGLRAEHFYHEDSHGRLYSAMAGMHERGEPIDRVTLLAECKRLGVNPDYVDFTMANVPDPGNWPAYVKAVKATHRRRSLLEAADLLVDAALDDKPALIAEAERILSEHEANTSVYTPERQAAAIAKGDASPAIAPWPWEALNFLTKGGIRAGQTTYVFARTNFGKSPIVDDMLFTGKRAGLSAALYINEMGEGERAMRFSAYLTDLGFERILGDEITPAERAELADTMARESIPIVNAAGWTAEDVCRDIARSGWDIAGVDGLHLFPHDGEADLTRMVLAFTNCAKRSQCHIVIAGHLNNARALEAETPPPVLRDIRGSGMIPNVADFIVFLHRDQTEDGFPIKNGPGRIWIAKARNSGLGGTRCRYDGEHMRFTDRG